MKIEFKQNSVTLTREPGDPKFYGIREAKGEHALFHYLKTELNKQGNNLIKKRAQKDGHSREVYFKMSRSYQPYLRTRSSKSPGINVAVYSGFYQIRSAAEDWNEGQVTLMVEPDFWTR
jgi:hypothetical protein